MRNFILIVAAIFSLAACDNAGGQASGGGEMSTQNDSIAYAIGVYLTQQMQTQGVTINPTLLHQGYTDLQNGKGMDAATAGSIIRQYSLEMQTRQGAPVTDESPLSINIDSLSLALGADFSNNMKTNEVELNDGAMLAGATDFLSEGGAKIDDTQTGDLIKTFSAMVQEKAQVKAAAQGKINQAEGEAFLAENANKEGVKTTETGLQYKVLRAGTGKSPVATDEVEVHYEGRLLDGTVFDSSYERGQPISFPLSGVIPGWTEGVQLMKTGAKYQFYIPSDLAYGLRGSPPNIGPNSTLIFDVELISIK